MLANSIEALPTVDLKLGGKRPASDRLAMERARARTELALFGHAAPAQTGRYEILEPIAGGGMGFVYAGYDPQLDRQVALKVLHPERNHEKHAHDRLIREARALARLDHRNVVTVHDVLTHDGEIVIVMELVAGDTLADWQAAAHRHWRDVIAAYLQAGAGLAAAHSLDIIHRDFKPSNAIIGPDRRVRVLDFGLARFSNDARESGRTDSSRACATMATASGTILGTLGYAAPEQLTGQPVTAASDQFSFCVALHQAVEGVAPFCGATVGELIMSIQRDAPKLATDSRHVPMWLRSALRRGLAADPSHRYPSMQALLQELGRPRGWQRWRWPALGVLLAAASVLATVELNQPDTLPHCDGGAGKAADVWGPRQRDAVADRITSLGTTYGTQVVERVLTGLDDSVRQWSSVHHRACLAHRSGTGTDALIDRTTTCLQQRLDEVAGAVRVLEVLGRDDLVHALDIVAGLPSARICDNAARLLTEPDPPATPELRKRVAAVRAHLGQAAALARAGRAEAAARSMIETSHEAETTQYRPVIAEAKLAYGRVLASQAELGLATSVLRDAMQSALVGGQTSLAVEAAARRIYTEGLLYGDTNRLRRDLDIVEPLSRSLIGDHFVRPLLLNNIGVAYNAAQRPDEALKYYKLAHDAMGQDSTPDLELTVIDRNIAMLIPDAATRTQLSRSSWQQLSSRLGEDHIDTLQAQIIYAAYGSDAKMAYELVTKACDKYHSSHPTFVDRYVDCESLRGFLASELHDRDAAQAAYAAAIGAVSGSADPGLIVAGRLAGGELALLRGEPSQARADFDAVVDADQGSSQWWLRKDALQAKLGLARAALAIGDRTAAIPLLAEAVHGFVDIVKINQRIEYRMRLAKARDALDSAW